MSQERRNLSGGAKPRRSRADAPKAEAAPTGRGSLGSRSPARELDPAAGEVTDLFGDFSEQTGAHFG